MDINALPHGIDTSVFYPRTPNHLIFEQIGFRGPAIAAHEKIIGIVATNQLRKDWGLAIEANPLISTAMAVGGVVAGVASAKAIAIGFGILLHLRRVHNLVAALSAIYFAAAILPWTALFLTH